MVCNIAEHQKLSLTILFATEPSKLNEPKQIYNTLKSNIDSAVKFDSYSLSGTNLRSDMIAKREIWLAVPDSTNKTQWAEINRAVSYGQGLGIEVKITQVK